MENLPEDFKSELYRYEFYVSSGSKDLMRKLNTIMRKDGYIGLADGGGKMRYIVDGSSNLYESAATIKMILREQEEALLASGAPERRLALKQERRRDIEAFLKAKGLKANLKGFIYLRAILEMLLESGEEYPDVSKKVLAEICERYRTGRKAADRVIRYSLKQAGIKMSNSQAIAAWSDALRPAEAERQRIYGKGKKTKEDKKE